MPCSFRGAPLSFYAPHSNLRQTDRRAATDPRIGSKNRSSSFPPPASAPPAYRSKVVSAMETVRIPEHYHPTMPTREDRADTLRLRPTAPSDLPSLFEMHADPESNAMAGTKPRTREEFFEVWDGIFADPGVTARVIELDGVIVGSIGCFQADGKDCVGYWIARPHWGKGIASRALMLFLGEERRRPLHATTTRTNTPSQRVLEKCGFRRVGSRVGAETERYVPGEIGDFVLE
jgi:RimJ/RimL family protein N-acetyltransferase